MAKLPDGLTVETIMEAVEASHSGLDNPGFCLGCGERADGVEPDARKYKCDSCGKHKVYGAEELLFMIA